MYHLEKYKCPDCGGSVRLFSEEKKAVCNYCGNAFYFKEDKSEALVLALNNANEHLKRNDFDNAIDGFNAIHKEYPTDAEAAWGLVLSIYGIVYTQDERSGKMVPTCSRIVRESILDHEAYFCAISEAAPEQRQIYQSRAQEIDLLQKRIKLAMEAEEDFDVFISFKAKDENGASTEDSAIARRIYDELEKRGIKTFFSEVTLRNRIGDEFEPIIYRALYSCKFFILVATKEEYFNAAWVKNEWTRFRDRVAEENLSGACSAVFKNVSPYIFPRVFQAQGVELDKHPYDYDVLIADNLSQKLGISARQNVYEEDRTAPLLKRVFLFLEDGDWLEANNYCEKVLDIDPENGNAYLGKLMAELRISKRAELWTAKQPFENNPNYKKAIRFGDPQLVRELNEQLSRVKERMRASAIPTPQPQYTPPAQTPRPRVVPPSAPTNSAPLIHRYDEQNGGNTPKPPFLQSTESEAEIKARVKQQPNIKRLLVIGIILLICCFYVGVAMLIYRAYLINKSVQEEKQKPSDSYGTTNNSYGKKR